MCITSHICKKNTNKELTKDNINKKDINNNQLCISCENTNYENECPVLNIKNESIELQKEICPYYKKRP